MAARSGVIYGETGTRKTTQVARFAKYIYKRYGQQTLLISGDGGGYAPCQPLIDAGIIRVERVPPLRSDTLTLYRKFLAGWRRRAVTKPNLFAKPGDPATITTAVLGPMTDAEWKDIGAVAIEGWTSISDAIMADMTAFGRSAGQDAVDIWTTSAADMAALGLTAAAVEKFSSPSKGHYGFVQNEIYRLTQSTLGLPVKYVLWTALEGGGEEPDAARKAVIGPAISGRKAVGKAPSWVGDCIHLDTHQTTRKVAVDGGPPETVIETGVRAWFTRHLDPVTSVPYPAKPRVPEALWPEFLARWPKGYFDLTADQGLDTYLEFVDELTARGKSAEVAWKLGVDEERQAQAQAGKVK